MARNNYAPTEFRGRILEQDVVDKATTPAIEVFKRKKSIELDDFADLYKDVEVDKKIVADLQAQYSQDYEKLSSEELLKHQLAKVFEAVVLEEVEAGQWLGDGAITTRASRYDDFVNGVDMVVSYQQESAEPTHMALAIDITTSHE